MGCFTTINGLKTSHAAGAVTDDVPREATFIVGGRAGDCRNVLRALLCPDVRLGGKIVHEKLIEEKNVLKRKAFCAPVREAVEVKIV